ncbi:MAG: Ig-like domain-containing protein, partial [Nitrospirota bacterium]
MEVRLLLTPVAVADSYSMINDVLNTSAEAQPSVLANDSVTPPGGSLTAVLVSGPANGSVTLNSNGHFVYTPTLGYAGSDSFTYKAFDGISYSSATNVSLTVTKQLSARTNSDDRPLTGVEGYGSVGASAFAGDVQVAQAVGDGYSLSYQSLSEPRPVIAVEATYAPGTSSPSSFEVQWSFNGVAQTTEWYGTSSSGTTVRFTVQADATSLATGRYNWSMNVVAHYSGSDIATRLYSGSVEIVNLNASNFGDNWTVTQLDRLVLPSGGALLARGDGTTAWFTSSGGSFSSPAGPFATTTLTQLGDGTYRLTDKFGNKANFSTTGLLTSRVDRNGNTTSFAYIDANGDGIAEELSSITDPFGRVTAFAYAGGLLASVTDHAGRVTTVTKDGQGRVTAITARDPDGAGPLSAPVTAYSYSGTTRRLTSVTDPLNHATSVAYDFAGRVSQISYAASSTNSCTIW